MAEDYYLLKTFFYKRYEVEVYSHSTLEYYYCIIHNPETGCMIVTTPWSKGDDAEASAMNWIELNLLSKKEEACGS